MQDRKILVEILDKKVDYHRSRGKQPTHVEMSSNLLSKLRELIALHPSVETEEAKQELFGLSLIVNTKTTNTIKVY